MIRFTIEKKSSQGQARVGRLETSHGVVETPVFMPVGTLACVKALDPADLDRLGAGLILSNAYHLMQRPGSDQVAKRGGLHRFMGYGGGILTDSGGFQVFSLASRRKVTDEGVVFRSHVDGRLIALTPEKLVATQEALQPDMAMVLDECPSAQLPRQRIRAAMDRTLLWAERCLAARTASDLAWLGIVQGGLFEDLRAIHAQQISALPLDGFAIGGVSVGESPEDIDRVVRWTAPLLPWDKPRYLMGVGTPDDLVRGVDAGVDMFDCVMPTRNARNGQLFTSKGKVIIKKALYRDKEDPIDEACACYTCQNFSCAYLRHLFVSGEISYHRLASIHNLAFYLRLMARMRAAICNDVFDPKDFLAG